MDFLSGAYFEVYLSGSYLDDENRDQEVTLSGRFTSVSGLGAEVEYEIYNEGGRNFPRYFFKESKPQVLTLERGVLTSADEVSELMRRCARGQMIPLSGEVTLKDSFDTAQRSWSIDSAYLQKYVGPDLNSNQAALAVSRLELIYNGCY